VLASVVTSWGPLGSINDLALSVYNAGGEKLADANTFNGPGLTGKHEGSSLRGITGALRVQLSQVVGGTGAEAVRGMFEVTRAEYAPLSDLEGLSPEGRAAIQAVLRTYVMKPYGPRFRPGFGVTRSELAATLVRGAQIPQYLPGKPRYTDVTDRETLLFVESVQNVPDGSLFPDAVPGGRFRPDDFATRLAATVALVRAAGLQAQAEATSTLPSWVKDANTIPTALRGYVAVALEKGLMTAEDGQFQAQSAITRAQLAHSMLMLWRQVN
jgi:hypothetical protein